MIFFLMVLFMLRCLSRSLTSLSVRVLFLILLSLALLLFLLLLGSLLLLLALCSCSHSSLEHTEMAESLSSDAWKLPGSFW